MGKKQKSREVEVETTLDSDVLLFKRMVASEQLSRLFNFEIEFLSPDRKLDLSRMLGQKLTVRLNLSAGGERYFNGHISRFSQTGENADFAFYQATVRPWLWFLTRTADCRIFQKKTVPEMVKEVFRYYGFSDFSEQLNHEYREWDYRVQYRETAFNFISRILEEEGIYYYFQHENDKHTLILSDAMSSHRPFPQYEKFTYSQTSSVKDNCAQGAVSSWQVSKELNPGTYALNDYDFTRPKANLQVKSSIIRDHAAAGMEIFDFPGEYRNINDGESCARRRIEELQAMYEKIEAAGNIRGTACGSIFTLDGEGHPDDGREYLIVSVIHDLNSDDYLSRDRSEEDNVYQSSFTVIPAAQDYRPVRSTPKPTVKGLQTAVVVGPAGKEVYVDKYGRVKVMFYWDRYSQADENSSCWIRVSQTWAGNKWGGFFHPRIGQEVIVEFLEGDPDYPVITGQLYNNDNMPPYDLPGNATRSGWKTHSSEKGSPDNFNEIRFEDKKDDEQLFIQAQRNFDIRVKNELKEWIGYDCHQIIENDLFQQVKGCSNFYVSGNRNEKTSGVASRTTNQDLHEKVGLNYALQALNAHLQSNLNIVIEAGLNITLKAAGNFISIGPAGIDITGTMVRINSGGAPVSGSGCSPESPGLPLEPGTSPPTAKNNVPEPLTTPPTPLVQAFKSAAVSGSPLIAK